MRKKYFILYYARETMGGPIETTMRVIVFSTIFGVIILGSMYAMYRTRKHDELLESAVGRVVQTGIFFLLLLCGIGGMSSVFGR